MAPSRPLPVAAERDDPAEVRAPPPPPPLVLALAAPSGMAGGARGRPMRYGRLAARGSCMRYRGYLAERWRPGDDPSPVLGDPGADGGAWRLQSQLAGAGRRDNGSATAARAGGANGADREQRSRRGPRRLRLITGAQLAATDRRGDRRAERAPRPEPGDLGRAHGPARQRLRRPVPHSGDRSGELPSPRSRRVRLGGGQVLLRPDPALGQRDARVELLGCPVAEPQAGRDSGPRPGGLQPGPRSARRLRPPSGGGLEGLSRRARPRARPRRPARGVDDGAR